MVMLYSFQVLAFLFDIFCFSSEKGDCFLSDTSDIGPEINQSDSGRTGICIPQDNTAARKYQDFRLDDLVSRKHEIHSRSYRWLRSRNISLCDEFGFDGLMSLLEPTDETSRKQQKNLMALLATDGTDLSDNIPPNVMKFEQAMKILPRQWSNSSLSYVFYRDDPGCTDGDCLLIQRVQRSGNCFIHAAIMLQYCLMSRSNKTINAGAIVDIRVFIRDISGSLEPYILNRGGQVSDVFKEIVQGDPELYPIALNEMDATFLKTYGPVVLTFEMSIFGSHDNLVYKGIPAGHTNRFHSVLIIGIRMEGNSSLFLAQNWWTTQQIVEISREYASESMGKAYFIKDKALVIRNGLPWTKKKYGQL
jgi:hypothetical protein